MSRSTARALVTLAAVVGGALFVVGCGAQRALPAPADLAIASASLTSCTTKVPESPLTCAVDAVISNDGRTATTLDYSRLLLRDAQGGSYPPVAPTGVATLAAGGSLPVTLSFVIFQSRTPTQLELEGVVGSGGSVSRALAAPAAAPSAAPSSPPASSVRPTPRKPRPADSHAPPPSTAPVYVPPPVYAPPPVYYPPPANPVSGGFGNG